MNRNELNVVNNVQCSFVRKVVGGKLNYIKIKKKKEKKNKVCFMLQFYFIDGHYQFCLRRCYSSLYSMFQDFYQHRGIEKKINKNRRNNVCRR